MYRKLSPRTDDLRIALVLTQADLSLYSRAAALTDGKVRTVSRATDWLSR